MHAIQCRPAAEDLQFLDRLPPQECAQEPAEAQDVVEVAVGQQYPRQVPETDPGLQDLPLGTLAAVDEKAEFVVLHDLRGKSAPRRRRGCRSAKEQDFEQRGFPCEAAVDSQGRMLIAQLGGGFCGLVPSARSFKLLYLKENRPSVL